MGMGLRLAALRAAEASAVKKKEKQTNEQKEKVR